MNSYSLDYIDDLYVQYVRDPSSVSETWRQYFEQFLIGAGAPLQSQGAAAGTSRTRSAGPTGGGVAVATRAESLGMGSSGANVHGSGNGSRTAGQDGSTGNESADQALWMARIQDRIDQLVREYRVRGHLVAQLDPLGLFANRCPELSPQSHGLSDQDL